MILLPTAYVYNFIDVRSNKTDQKSKQIAYTFITFAKL